MRRQDKDILNNYIVNVVICYANEDEVIQYGRQLEKQSIKEKIILVIVINKKNKGLEYLKEELDKIHIVYELLQPKTNLGYLNGLIYGFSRCGVDTGWYVLSNTDIEIPNENFFEDFLCNYENDTKNWVVGPTVYAPLKRINSNPYMLEKPSKFYYLSKNIGMSFPILYDYLFKIKNKLKRRELPTLKTSCSVYAVHGSYMFVRNDLLRIMTEKDKWELLYDEEQYIAEVVLSYGKNIFYDARFLVKHMEGTSTGKVNISNRYRMMKRANKRILKEFY